ncbi:MAG: hypothetical protein Q8K86_10675 [Candidatus Nanopelagicaceae bacterium]|nr:hypothetical protein [Candidatus Nanopelagicaceae bacterium]
MSSPASYRRTMAARCSWVIRLNLLSFIGSFLQRRFRLDFLRLRVDRLAETVQTGVAEVKFQGPVRCRVSERVEGVLLEDQRAALPPSSFTERLMGKDATDVADDLNLLRDSLYGHWSFLHRLVSPHLL